MILPHTTIGTGEPPLTFVHGFTQTRTSWMPVATELAPRHRCILVDAPHHGEAHDRDVTFDQAADLVADTAVDSVLVGYSMGGRLALAAAVRHSSSLRALVLVSATAGIVDDAERETRRAADEALAARIEAIGTDEFLREWTTQPMFAKSTIANDDYQSRRTNDPHSLAQSLRQCSTGMQVPLWAELGQITIPTLVLAGERDGKYVDIAERLHRSIRGSELAIVSDAGHATHLDRPLKCVALLADFVARRVSR